MTERETPHGGASLRSGTTADQEVVERSGVKLLLDPAVISPRMLSVIRDGWYETEEIRFLASVIRRGDRVLELGGGIGFISSYVALHTPAAAVATIEANPELIPIMRKVHALNGVSVDVTWGIIGRDPGVAAFNVHEDFWASSAVDFVGVKRCEVPVYGLTDVLKAVRPQVLIVDIEGGEMLLSEQQGLGSVRDIILEVHEAVIGKAGVERIFANLSALGFRNRSEIPSTYVVALSRTARIPAHLQVRRRIRARIAELRHWLTNER